jgi:glycosyltransferase involved in cell wall biosynthesis
LEFEKNIKLRGGKIYHLPDIKISLGQSFYRSFSQLLWEHPYSIVHGHLLNSAFLYLGEAKRQKIPHRIIHTHNTVSGDRVLKRLRNNVLASGIPLWANHFLACSSLAARNMFHGKSNEATIIHNGIDVSRFHYNSDVRQETRKELHIPDNVLCIGNVARFTPQKNHDFLLRIFEIVHKKTDSVLVLVGSGPLEESIIKKARARGIFEFSRFLGPRVDVARLYQAFDIFLLPSIFEGFGIVAVEAQCSGLPSIVSDRVPKEITCSNNIMFLPLDNIELWVDTALKLAGKARVDGSSGVMKAGLDIVSMGTQLKNVYTSFL